MTEKLPYGKGGKMLIHIKAENVDRAISGNSSHCMIADAIKEQVPGAQRVSVDLQSIRFSIPERGKRYTFWTPQLAQHALLDFDLGHDIEEFSFCLGHAAQITPTYSGRTAVKNAKAKVKKATAAPKKSVSAKKPISVGTGGVPTAVGGKTAPFGALAAGAGTGSVKAAKGSRTGARRAYGLRALAGR